MKQKWIMIFYAGMQKLGLFKLFYFLNRNKTIYLTYHHVLPDALFDHQVHLGVSHSESVFEMQMQHIKKRFFKKNKQRIQITFDDGYQNQYEIASPILKKYQLNGIYFISSALFEKQKTLPVDLMTQWVSYVPAGSYTLFNKNYAITDKNRYFVSGELYNQLLSNSTLWNRLESELNQAFSFDALTVSAEMKRLRFDAMTEAQLSKLKLDGHQIGAHGDDHRPLASLSINQQRADFAVSKQFSEKYCNTLHYSYPYGGKDEVSSETIRLCEEIGFDMAFINATKKISPQSSERFQIPRIALPNTTNVILLDAKLSGFESFCKTLGRRNG